MDSSLFAQFPLIAEIDEIRGLDNFYLSTTRSMLLNEIDEAWIRQVSFAPPEVDRDHVLLRGSGEYVWVGYQIERQRLGYRPILVLLEG